MPSCAQVAQLLKAGQKGRKGPLQLPQGFFEAPSHHAARILRDIYADDAVAATMEVRGRRAMQTLQVTCIVARATMHGQRSCTDVPEGGNLWQCIM